MVHILLEVDGKATGSAEVEQYCVASQTLAYLHRHDKAGVTIIKNWQRNVNPIQVGGSIVASVYKNADGTYSTAWKLCNASSATTMQSSYVKYTEEQTIEWCLNIAYFQSPL